MKEVGRAVAATFTLGASEAIGGLFDKPDVPASPDVNKPAELTAEQKQIDALKTKEKKKQANRVATILTGPGGLEDEIEKKQMGGNVLLGGGKK